MNWLPLSKSDAFAYCTLDHDKEGNDIDLLLVSRPEKIKSGSATLSYHGCLFITRFLINGQRISGVTITQLTQNSVAGNGLEMFLKKRLTSVARLLESVL